MDYLNTFYFPEQNIEEDMRFHADILVKPSARSEHNTHKDGDIYVGDDGDNGGVFGDQEDNNIWPTYPVTASGDFIFQNPKKPPQGTRIPKGGRGGQFASRGVREDFPPSDYSDSSDSDSSGDDMYTVMSNPKVLHCTTLHCTALHCTAPHCTALHYTAPHCTALHNTAPHCTALHNTTLHCTALHCTALHCTALHCTTLDCTTVYCTVLYLAALRV